MREKGASGSGGDGKGNGEEEELFTVSEYLENLEEQEKEAELVLGGDAGDNCSYDEGYRPRQVVFVCQTCTPNGMAGVCLGCSLVCHDQHEVVEIWTRRRFRCDCGNSKFSDTTCKLQPNKDALNSKNAYNQNFTGVYCVCHRPYPDPDRTEQEGDERMTQCAICEDWFHEEHLGIPAEQIASEDDHASEDFICGRCVVDRVPFIRDYRNLRLFPASDESPLGSGLNGSTDASMIASLSTANGSDSSAGLTNGCDGEGHGNGCDGEGHCVKSKGKVASLSTANGSVSSAAVTNGCEGERHGNGCDGEGHCVKSKGKEVEPKVDGIEPRGRKRLSQDGSENQAGRAYLCKRKHPYLSARHNISTVEVTEKDGVPVQQSLKDGCITEPASAGNGCVHLNGVVGQGSREGTGRETAGMHVIEDQLNRCVVSPHGLCALFLKKGWRLELCVCDECRTMYEENGVDFLLDPDDTMQQYQEKGKAKIEQRRIEMEAVQNNLWTGLGRSGQVELLHGFNDLAESLRSFLVPFGETGQPVTEKDIRSFFEELKEKRRRLT